MTATVLYFVTDEQGQHIMTAPASTLEAIFGLTAEQVMRMLSETSEPDREHRIARQGRRVTDKTIRVRRLATAVPDLGKSCSTCKHFAETVNDPLPIASRGECRRYPQRFGPVSREYWCGEYSPRGGGTSNGDG